MLFPRPFTESILKNFDFRPSQSTDERWWIIFVSTFPSRTLFCSISILEMPNDSRGMRIGFSIVCVWFFFFYTFSPTRSISIARSDRKLNTIYVMPRHGLIKIEKFRNGLPERERESRRQKNSTREKINKNKRRRWKEQKFYLRKKKKSIGTRTCRKEKK